MFLFKCLIFSPFRTFICHHLFNSVDTVIFSVELQMKHDDAQHFAVPSYHYSGYLCNFTQRYYVFSNLKVSCWDMIWKLLSSFLSCCNFLSPFGGLFILSWCFFYFKLFEANFCLHFLYLYNKLGTRCAIVESSKYLERE